jgi:hypothetical protein
MKPQPSWWQRFTATLLRPPVLALATVVVLVGGGAVLFDHRAEMKETAPGASVPTEGNAARSPALELRREDTRDEGAAREEKAAPAALPPADAETASPAGEPAAERAPHVSTGKVAAPPKLPTSRPSPMTETVQRDLKKEPPAPKEDAAPPKRPETVKSKGAGGENELSDAVKPTTRGAVPAPLAAPSDEPGIGGPAVRLSTAELVKKWEEAAAANNCELANRYGAQLAERDRAAYIKAFESSSALKNCYARQAQ